MQLSTFQANKFTVFIFRLLFSARTWKYLFILAALASLYANYLLAKQVYVIKCSAGGMFLTKARCAELAENEFNAREYFRVQYIQAEENQDLFD